MINLLIPIITIPYISRTIGAEGIGINAFSSSIVQMFALFALLGVPLYGNRQIASVKHLSRKETSNQFWSIYTVQLLCSIIVLIIYLLYVQEFVFEYRMIYFAQSLLIVASMFDISWLFIGLEELKKVVLRNAFIKLVSLLFMFVFVKDEQDLLIYVLVNVLAAILGQMIMWTQVSKYIDSFWLKQLNIVTHIKPIVLIFLPQFIIQIYAVLDRVFLGFFSNEVEVGYYDQALKIVKVTLTLVYSVNSVMLPRIASEFAQGNISKIRQYSEFVLTFVLFITLPLMVGISVISPYFAPWFFGPGYDKVGVLMTVMSPIVFFLALSNVFGMQLLIPMHKQSKVTIAVSIGAAISIVSNLLLIKEFASVGAAVSTVLAEIAVTCVMLYFIKEFALTPKLIRSFFKYGIMSLLMGVLIFYLGYKLSLSNISTVILQVTTGAIFYSLFLLVSKDRFVFGIIKRFKTRKG